MKYKPEGEEMLELPEASDFRLCLDCESGLPRMKFAGLDYLKYVAACKANMQLRRQYEQETGRWW